MNNELNEAIEQLDFDIILDTMKKLDWKWVGVENIQKQDLLNTINYLYEHLSKDENCESVGTGGFVLCRTKQGNLFISFNISYGISGIEE